MSNQTESYIVLKPIAERFARVAADISDDEIRQIIKSEMREQLGRIRFGDVLSELADEWFEDEDHINMIWDTFTSSVKNRMKF
ncbi:hypothetical protein SDC9_46813 [bioreactor metagenome]|uniref:Uncharacterized protein n=1 Tax=bioreactor metagenome TaxID=1076179 RepID=A0A644W9W5_9ZZZZ